MEELGICVVLRVQQYSFDDYNDMHTYDAKKWICAAMESTASITPCNSEIYSFFSVMREVYIKGQIRSQEFFHLNWQFPLLC